MAIAIISHPDCLLHEQGNDHPESPERVKVIQAALVQYSFKVPITFHLASIVRYDQLLRVHDHHYVDWLVSLSPEKGVVTIDEDTVMNPFTLKAAYYAAGAVIKAVDLVMANKAQAVFCNVRPPGHHAEKGKAMGFCFFNNVAVGVAHAIQQYYLTRVAIIDFDVHHGNGTQDIFQARSDVLYCSSFEHPFYPGYEKEKDNEHVLSVPLPAETNGTIFREKVQAAWFPQLYRFQPQLIFFSAGFDAHTNDPLANLRLTKDDYVWLTTEIAKLAKLYSGGKMISVLEGGYSLEVLSECVPAHVEAML